jgi:outer membrane protein assembly factor BamA
MTSAARVARVAIRGAALTAIVAFSPLLATAQAPGPLPAGKASPGAATIVSLRVHGNHTTPDEEVLRLSGLQPGAPFDDGTLTNAESRLRESGRFRHVEVLKRFASFDDPSAIVVVVLVEEVTGVSVDVPMPGPLRKVRANTMFLPVLDFEDGFGLTYGVRFSVVDVIGRNSRLSVPLTWGGERLAGATLERTFETGPFTRVEAAGRLWRREYPATDIPERRAELSARVERALVPWLRVGAFARGGDVAFGDVDDRVRIAGADATLDTRNDPSFPRSGVCASTGWERIWLDSGPAANRTRTEVLAYLGLPRQLVLAVRGQHVSASSPLPLYEQAPLGGTSSLRGYRLGYRTGDQLTAGSLELRVPWSSPLSVGRMGVVVFADAGTVYAAGEELAHARFDRGYGAGLFVTAPVFSTRFDVANAPGEGTRAHFTLGVRF